MRVIYLVVDITVGEHGVEVLHALASPAVVVILQTFLDGAHVHRLLDDFMVILREDGYTEAKASASITQVALISNQTEWFYTTNEHEKSFFFHKT